MMSQVSHVSKDSSLRNTYGTNLMQCRTHEYYTRECEWQRLRVRVQTLTSTSNSNVPIASTRQNYADI